jgi:hypothetical protein
MNLFRHSDMGTAAKIAVFVLVFIPTVGLTAYTVLISRRLATFMEALSSERMTWSEKTAAFRQIWSAPKRVRQQRAAEGDEAARPVPHRSLPAQDVATSSD